LDRLRKEEKSSREEPEDQPPPDPKNPLVLIGYAILFGEASQGVHKICMLTNHDFGFTARR